MTTINEIGEFGLIERLAAVLPTAPAVLEGIGDDCAVLRVFDRTLLVSCDLSVEGVHFSRETMSPEVIGWRAAASGLSDIAAMGGAPSFCLIALACPGDCDVTHVEDLYRGLSDAVLQAGAVIVGGDTTRSADRLTIDVTVIGDVVGERYLLRRGAQVGDKLAVTGRPGTSAGGLDALTRKQTAPELIRAHEHPCPRIAEGQWLCACSNVHAMLDVSDGVVQDAGHLSKAAGLGIDIDPESVLIDSALSDYCAAHGLDPLALALTGGEDYELLFAVDGADPEATLALFRREFRTDITVIGSFTNQWQDVRVAGDPIDRGGFDHFAPAD
ncbi:MAG: thiamine-phosphate kinase [Nitrospiraceae bacterium]|nr:thiamine-phosphate kinase [Nitrospiraceae bacterium]